LEIRFDRNSTVVDVGDCEDLLESNWLLANEAVTKVNDQVGEFDTGLSSFTREKEIVFWSTYDLKLKLIVLEIVLSDR